MKTLTKDQREWVEANLAIARKAAGKARRRIKKHSYDEILSSSLFGLCQAPFQAGFSKDPEAYAGTSCKHWIYRDLRTQARRMLRDRRYLSDLGDREMDFLSCDPEQEQYEQEEQINILRGGIESLKSKQRRIIKGKLAGLQIKEMTKKWSISKSAIMQSQRLALMNLRKVLE